MAKASEVEAQRAVDKAKKVEAYLNRKREAKRGTVIFREPGWHYFSFDYGQHKGGFAKAELMRHELEQRCFEPVNGPSYKGDEVRRERVVGQPYAEIWRIEQEHADRYHRERVRKAKSDKTWLKFQASRVQTVGAFVPED